MKRNIYLLGMAGLLAFASCSKDKSNTPLPPDTPPPVTGGNVDVRGKITKDTHWTSNNVYRIRGYVYVDNATLTIDPGTKIVSNKDSAGVLIIYKGSKIMAAGTSSNPIVFTSNETDKKPGDFGGLIIAGLATGNGNHEVIEGGVDGDHKSFGGTNDADNSGVLQYVRIEYAGKAVNPGDEVNGLSMYTVGSGTTVDHVQVVRGLDDAFEFFGGAFNAKYLIAYNNADDDFDFDDGYHGKIQFAVSIKDPAFTDEKGTTGDISNNFEFDNTTTAKGFLLQPNTFPLMSNFTAIGPNNAANTSAAYGYNARFRRGAKFILANSVVMGGQKAGIVIDDNVTAQYYKDGISGVKNTLVASAIPNFNVDRQSATNPALTADSFKALITTRDGTVAYSNVNDIGLTDAFNNAAPNLIPKMGSPALAGAKFEGSINDNFFTKVSYLGAIDPSNDWTKAAWVSWGR